MYILFYLFMAEWNETMTYLNNKGIKVLVYVNPNLNSQGDLFKEGDLKGYFIKDSTDKTHLTNFGEFTCGTVDFTNPNAYNWYKRKCFPEFILFIEV